MRKKLEKRLTTKKWIKLLDDKVRNLLKECYDNVCVTCNRKVDWYNPKTNTNGLTVGHYISRRVTAVRWDIDNVFPQCASCNFEHNKNPAPYTNYLIREFGIKRINDLERKVSEYRQSSNKKLTIDFLEGKGEELDYALKAMLQIKDN